jgi:hypothetical protein
MLRQLTAAGLVVTGLTAMTGVASANPITVSAKVNTGTVSITRTADPVTGDVDYAVSINGQIRDHGWNYSGELSGTRQSASFPDSLSEIGAFDVTSNPAGVTGMCTSYSTFGSLTANYDDPVDAEFECVLSKDGSTPWLTALSSALTPAVTDANATMWQGYYAQTETTTPTLRTASPSHGDSQVVENSYGGDGGRYTLQLSGQIAIGSSLYTGEISSDWSDRYYLHDGNPTPTVNVSGSNGGHTVAGPCTGAVTSSGWDWDCSLSLDSSPSVDVKLGIRNSNSGIFCSGSNANDTYACDTYTTGNYSGD